VYRWQGSRPFWRSENLEQLGGMFEISTNFLKNCTVLIQIVQEAAGCCYLGGIDHRASISLWRSFGRERAYQYPDSDLAHFGLFANVCRSARRVF
jgi:hypothetical protein